MLAPSVSVHDDLIFMLKTNLGAGDSAGGKALNLPVVYRLAAIQMPSTTYVPQGGSACHS